MSATTPCHDNVDAEAWARARLPTPPPLQTCTTPLRERRVTPQCENQPTARSDAVAPTSACAAPASSFVTPCAGGQAALASGARPSGACPSPATRSSDEGSDAQPSVRSLQRQVGALQSENQQLKERVRELEAMLASRPAPFPARHPATASTPAAQAALGTPHSQLMSTPTASSALVRCVRAQLGVPSTGGSRWSRVSDESMGPTPNTITPAAGAGHMAGAGAGTARRRADTTHVTPAPPRVTRANGAARMRPATSHGADEGVVSVGVCAATPSTGGTSVPAAPSTRTGAAVGRLSFGARPPRRESTGSVGGRRSSIGTADRRSTGDGLGGSRLSATSSTHSMSRYARRRFRLSATSVDRRSSGARQSMESVRSALSWADITPRAPPSYGQRRLSSQSVVSLHGVEDDATMSMELTHGDGDSKAEGDVMDGKDEHDLEDGGSQASVVCECEHNGEEGCECGRRGSMQSSGDPETDEEMARRLMEEENAEAYNQLEEAHVVAVMDMSEEDLANLAATDADLAMAIQLMREEVRLAQEQQAEAQGQQGDGGDAEGGEHAGTPAGAPLVFDDSREMTYEQMLALGEQLGDVRQERWRQRAPAIIAALPTRVYRKPVQDEGAAAETATAGRPTSLSLVASSPPPPVANVSAVASGEDEATSEADVVVQVDETSALSLNLTALSADASTGERCLVCQCCFDDGDEVKELPCEHEYHTECIDQWLADHDTCPLCSHSVDTRRSSSPSVPDRARLSSLSARRASTESAQAAAQAAATPATARANLGGSHDAALDHASRASTETPTRPTVTAAAASPEL